MQKTSTFTEIVRYSENVKNEGKSLGLVVGSFDILHLGHLNLFRLAKKHVDFLIVGLDRDETIRLTKGINRPINNYERRSAFLNEVRTVDKVFLIERISKHGSEESIETFTHLIGSIKPTHIFTHIVCDRHWREKEILAKNIEITCVLDKSKKITNSGTIIDLLELEL